MMIHTDVELYIPIISVKLTHTLSSNGPPQTDVTLDQEENHSLNPRPMYLIRSYSYLL
jgi:hypothetical protein